MGHKHSVRDTGAHFTIDQYTRQIKNDSANKTTIVQYDHNSERLTFEMPLYIDGHAMTLCDLIEIHYINISTDGNSQNPGTYEVKDIKAEGENAIFTWLISQEATQLAGSLSFFIVFKCTENGVTVYRWGTEICKTLAISAGMDNGEAVLTEYPDILAQWKAQLFDASDTAVTNVATAEASALAAIEAAGEAKKQAVLDSIPEEYTALNQNVEKNAAKINELASAIKGELSGPVVRADDVSPVEHNPLVLVHGKNLFNINALEVMPENYTVRISAIDAENNSFTITSGETHTGNGYCGLTNADGNYAPTLRDLCPQLKIGKTYVLSGTTDTATKTLYLRGASKSWVFNTPLTITKEHLDSKIAMYGLNSANGEGTGDCVISNIQIEEGETATEYTPYIDPSTVTVSRHGKNLAYGGTTESSTSSGITITRTPGFSAFLFDGKAEKATSMGATSPLLLPAGTYTVSVYGLNRVSATFDRCYVLKQSDKSVIVNEIMPDSPKSFTLAEPTEVAISFVLAEATSYSSKYIRLQMECGDTATDYVECVEATTHTPNAAGAVSSMTSLSPCMTILTDTAGAIVECEYNIDTKTYIDNKIKEMMEGVE